MARVRPQVARRIYDGACLLCGEQDRSCLQAHRVVPGCRYVYESLVTLCASCHGKWHGGADRLPREAPFDTRHGGADYR